ncbi:HlyD family efflux transporter periplasmic adaptor subunit [Sulfitobacter sp. BDSS02]|nr:HlyD family efflux transporter periplasmic adaptor subunit [Sulfitobacter sp. BDSS02]MBR9849732.1 HlyD family efflux transporter periplasmic adaptor subunit [Paracoccaceae bacterium]
MMARKTMSRPILIGFAAILLVAGIAFAFWPRPMMVDLGEVTRGQMRMTVDEQGKTRVRDAFVVSTPMDGRLLRVEVMPGDPIKKDVTVVAQMRPSNPAALDIRTRGQALAAVEAAEAALHVAEANMKAASADADLAKSDLKRTEQLADSGTVSLAALDRAQSAARAAQARFDTATAAIEQQRAELRRARAQLIGFDDPDFYDAPDALLGEEMPIHAPTDGVILQVLHQDETTLAAGSPILVVGDIRDGLEVVVELISPDAINVHVGDPVDIENWGGAVSLSGVVTRVEPFGETKVSALGVEEQRVTAVVELTSTPEERAELGHGYAVEARIVVWSKDDALMVPSSALFREQQAWAVLVANDGTARLRQIEVGHDNGNQAEVLDGLAEGDLVVLYPPASLTDGMSVEQRIVE